jgi:prophage antirepressor-like protein
VFNFESHNVRTVIDDDGEIWFVAKDVALALGFSDTKKNTVTDRGRNTSHYKRQQESIVFAYLTNQIYIDLSLAQRSNPQNALQNG